MKRDFGWNLVPEQLMDQMVFLTSITPVISMLVGPVQHQGFPHQETKMCASLLQNQTIKKSAKPIENQSPSGFCSRSRKTSFRIGIEAMYVMTPCLQTQNDRNTTEWQHCSYLSNAAMLAFAAKTQRNTFNWEKAAQINSKRNLSYLEHKNIGKPDS